MSDHTDTQQLAVASESAANATPTIRKFRPDIEGLRAIAVLCVVIAHSGIGLHSGFIGVDIFFVISGFLITRHIFLEAIKTNTISLAQFYARRILRILPASMFVLLCTLLASFIWLSPLQFLNYATDALWATFSAFNYRLAIDGTDYFNTTTIPTPFQHYWSLCVEEQFYFIWPLIMLVLAKLFSKKSYFGNIVSAVLLVIIAVSLYLSYTITISSQPWAYFGLHTRAWQMAIGALLAVNIQKFANLPSRFASVLSWIGFGGLMYALATFTETTPYPSLWAVIPTLSTTLVVATGVNLNKASFESVFGGSIFQYIGKISYSWYLVHWPIMVIFLLAGERNNFVDQIASIVISFFVAVVHYYIIENPIRHNVAIKSKLKNTYILGLCLLLIAGSISGGLVYLKTKNLESKTNSQNSSEQQKAIIPDKTIDTEANLFKKIEEATKLKELPQNLENPLETIEKDKVNGCISLKEEVEINEKSICLKGDNTFTKTIAIIGDSHAHQWLDSIFKIAEKNKYKVATYTKSACPILDIKSIDGTLKRDYTECYSWREEVLKRMAKLKPDIIIHTGIIYKESSPEKYREMIQKFQSITKNVIQIVDNPQPQANLSECLVKNTNDITKCNFDTKKGLNGKTQRDAEIQVAKELGIQIVDTLPWFCDKDICPAIIDNIAVYRDNSHITNTYAKYLTNVLEQRLNLSK
jgi:peptidoglycan/LPS O-acetylase OafA/YrhL